MGGEAHGVFCRWCRGRSDVPKNYAADYAYFSPLMGFHYFHLYYIDPVDRQEIIFFWTMLHRDFYFQVDAQGLPALISWIHQYPFPFVDYDTSPNTSWDGEHKTCDHFAGSHSWDFLQGSNWFMWWFALMCWVCKKFWIWYVWVLPDNSVDIMKHFLWIMFLVCLHCQGDITWIS